MVKPATFSLYFHMNKLILSLFAALLSPTLLWAQTPVFTGEPSSWHEGFRRYDYLLDEHTLAMTPYKAPETEGFGVKDPPAGYRRCIVVVPQHPAPGNPWSWRGCYWDHQPQTEIELLKRGFFVAYISANATLAPDGTWDAFYTWLTRDKGLSPKPAFIGMSRGGEYEYRWATTHPDAISCIYADNPAVDRASLERLGGLAANDVPLLHVCGSIDPLYVGSTAAVENIYHAFGGRISVIIKEGFGHHPHSFHDATPIADFIEQSFREKTTAPPDFVKAVYAGPGAATKTYYYSTENTYRWVPAEKAWISERGPFFSGAYARYQLLIPGVDAFTTVIVPKEPAPGKPWVFRADYVTSDDRVDQALLAKGWTIVTGAVPYNYDGPVPAQWNAIYTYLAGYGFAAKPVLMGRGGAAGEAMGWAIANPEKVACVYAEDPILESKLMLGGKAPLDTLAPLAKAGVPLLFVCGAEDPSLAGGTSSPGQARPTEQTPPTGQAQLAATRYRRAGGKITVLIRKGEGHLLRPEDPAEVLEFIGRYAR
jgi:pimeloyl-ACP methyl ester carboxylesterase